MFKSLASTQAHSDSAWTVAWSHGDQKSRIVTGSVDNAVNIWEWDGATKIESKHSLAAHRLGVVSVDVNSTGTVAVSSSLDSQIKIWDLEHGNLINGIDAGPVNAFSVKFNPRDNGATLAAGSNTGKITLFDAEKGEKQAQLDTQGDFAMSLSYSPDATKIACGSINGSITLFDLTTGKAGSLMHQFTGTHAQPVRSIKFSPDQRSEVLFSACDDGSIKIFDTREAAHIGTMTGHASWVLAVDCNADGTQLATGSSDKTIKIWDLRSRKCLHTATDAHADQVWSVCYNHDGTRVASVGDDGKLHILECPTVA